MRAFADRGEAGRLLGDAVAERVDGEAAVVLAIPRGGVVVGAQVAARLGAPLDVAIPRKVGAPGNPELGLGAIAPGVRVLDERMIRDLRVSDDYLEREIAAQEAEIERRAAAYRGGRPPVEVQGRTVIVVDDGVATGGPVQAVPQLAREVDDLVVLATPQPFYAVGQWYDRFDQVRDDEVVALLSGSVG